MRFKALTLTAAAAMAVSLFCVPVHAEDTTITISEIDLTNVKENFDVGDAVKDYFGRTKVTLITDNDNHIKAAVSSEVITRWKIIGDSGLGIDGSLNSNGVQSPIFRALTTFEEGYYYEYDIELTFSMDSGYTVKTYYPLGTLKFSINGGERKNRELLIDNKDGTYKETIRQIYLKRPVYKDLSRDSYDVMYRMYNPNSGEHFYTKDENEKNSLVTAGWNFEGYGWYAPKSSSTPVYRVYNPNAGDHHYTMNGNEKDSLVAAGWNYEGIGWYSDDAKSVPLYRQYNPNAVAGAHNYTVNANERDMLVGAGWNDEGIGWYGI